MSEWTLTDEVTALVLIEEHGHIYIPPTAAASPPTPSPSSPTPSPSSPTSSTTSSRFATTALPHACILTRAWYNKWRTHILTLVAPASPPSPTPSPSPSPPPSPSPSSSPPPPPSPSPPPSQSQSQSPSANPAPQPLQAAAAKIPQDLLDRLPPLPPAPPSAHPSPHAPALDLHAAAHPPAPSTGPGPITNRLLLDPKSNLTTLKELPASSQASSFTDYLVVVSAEMWDMLVDVYGGGPRIVQIIPPDHKLNVFAAFSPLPLPPPPPPDGADAPADAPLAAEQAPLSLRITHITGPSTSSLTTTLTTLTLPSTTPFATFLDFATESFTSSLPADLTITRFSPSLDAWAELPPPPPGTLLCSLVADGDYVVLRPHALGLHPATVAAIMSELLAPVQRTLAAVEHLKAEPASHAAMDALAALWTAADDEGESHTLTLAEQDITITTPNASDCIQRSVIFGLLLASANTAWTPALARSFTARSASHALLRLIDLFRTTPSFAPAFSSTLQPPNLRHLHWHLASPHIDVCQIALIFIDVISRRAPAFRYLGQYLPLAYKELVLTFLADAASPSGATLHPSTLARLSAAMPSAHFTPAYASLPGPSLLDPLSLFELSPLQTRASVPPDALILSTDSPLAPSPSPLPSFRPITTDWSASPPPPAALALASSTTADADADDAARSRARALTADTVSSFTAAEDESREAQAAIVYNYLEALYGPHFALPTTDTLNTVPGDAPHPSPPPPSPPPSDPLSDAPLPGDDVLAAFGLLGAQPSVVDSEHPIAASVAAVYSRQAELVRRVRKRAGVVVAQENEIAAAQAAMEGAKAGKVKQLQRKVRLRSVRLAKAQAAVEETRSELEAVLWQGSLLTIIGHLYALVHENQRDDDDSSIRSEHENWKAQLVKLASSVVSAATYVGMVGLMKAGKSSTISGLVGLDVCPSRASAMTVIPTVITHVQGKSVPTLTLPPGTVAALNASVAMIAAAAASNPPATAAVTDGHPGLAAVLAAVTSPDSLAFDSEPVAGVAAVLDALVVANDTLRLVELLDVDGANPLESIVDLSDLPVIELEFAVMAETGMFGRLSFIDSPGPNEFGMDMLSGVLSRTLRQASIIAIVLNYASLQSSAQANINAIIEDVTAELQQEIYVFVNKFDQRNIRSGDMDEDEVKAFVSTNLFRPDRPRPPSPSSPSRHSPPLSSSPPPSASASSSPTLPPPLPLPPSLPPGPSSSPAPPPSAASPPAHSPAHADHKRIPTVKPQNVFAVSAKYAQYANTARQYLNSFALAAAAAEAEAAETVAATAEALAALPDATAGSGRRSSDDESESESIAISSESGSASSGASAAWMSGGGSERGGGDDESSSSMDLGAVEVPSPDEHEWVKDFARIAWGETWTNDNVYPRMLEENDVEAFKEGVDAVWHNSRLNEPLESMLRHCYTNAGIISLRQGLVATKVVSDAFLQDLHVQLSTVAASVDNLESFLATSAATLEVIRVSVDQIKEFAVNQASARLPTLMADAIAETSGSLAGGVSEVLELVDRELDAGHGRGSSPLLDARVLKAKFEEVFEAKKRPGGLPANVRFSSQEEATEFVDFMTHVFKVASSNIQDALVSKLVAGAKVVIAEIMAKVQEVLEPHLLSYQADVEKVLELTIAFPELEAPELGSFAADIQANTLRTLDKPSARKWAVFWLFKYIPVPSLRKSSAYEVSGRVIKDAFESGLQRVADATMDSAESMSTLFRTKVEEYGASVERELYRLMYRIKQTVDNKRSAHDHSVVVQQRCEELLWGYGQMAAVRADLLASLEARLLATGSFSAVDAGSRAQSTAVPSSSVLSPKSFEPVDEVLVVHVFDELPIGVPVAPPPRAAADNPAAATVPERLVLAPGGDVVVVVGDVVASRVGGRVWRGRAGETDVAVREVVVDEGPAKGAAGAVAAVVAGLTEPSVGRVLGYWDGAAGRVFVGEVVDGSELAGVVRQGELGTSDEVRVGILQDIVTGLAALHDAGVVHGDVCASNVMLVTSRRGRVKRAVVVRPRMAVRMSHDEVSKQVLRGAHVYYPPEVLAQWVDGSAGDGTEWTAAADIYAFGMVAWEVMVGASLAEYASHFAPADVVGGARPLVPQHVTDAIPAIVDLLAACWEPEPAQRPDCSQLATFLKTLQFATAFTNVF